MSGKESVLWQAVVLAAGLLAQARPLRAESYILPSSAFRTGANAAEYRTDVRLLNQGTTAVTVTATLYDQVTSTALPATPFAIEARSQVAFDNILQSLFGTTLSEGAYGPIRFDATGPIIVGSSVNNVNACGSGAVSGQWLPGIAASQALKAGTIGQLAVSASTSSGYRTNLVLMNPGTATATAVVKVRRGGGALLSTGTIGPLPANGFSQVPLDSSLFPGVAGTTDTNLWLEFTSDQPVLAYATMIHNVSGDPFAVMSSAQGTGPVFRAVAIPQCDGLGPGSEDCHFRMLFDPAGCGGGPCDRLVVFWSGGEQSCKDGPYDPILYRYAAAGFVAACAQPFTNAAVSHPNYQEFDRMDRILQRIRAEAASFWTGRKLLLTGVSHGASGPFAAIASSRSLRDHATNWTGSTHTAVVLYDGHAAPARLEEWSGRQPGCGNHHALLVGRYGDGKPTAHACNNAACFCSAPAHAADWAKDTTLIGATNPSSPYQCSDFTPAAGTVLYRFVSCGSGTTAVACDLERGDVNPDEQQRLPYDALKVCPGVIASYRSYPLCGHSVCGAWSCGSSDSVAWLEQNGW